MNDSVPKIGRSTKGGSLLSTVRERRLADIFLRYFSRGELTETRTEEPCFNHGTAKQTLPLNGNGSNGARTPSSNGARTPSLVTKASNTATAIYPRVAAAGAAPSEIPRWKRILDVTCILLTLPFWLPLMILIMGAIRFISSGPIFYRQERVGYRRKRFMIFKFRTMHVNTETRTHEEYFAHLMRVDCPMVKLDGKGDSRLIACGRFLRASGLDELPQIFNVLRGEMSLVGPRPCLPHEFQRYETWQQQRVSAPPGLTGYWQVNGKNKTTFNEMIAMDLFYARNMSVWLDLTIMLKTIPALIEQVLESRRKPGRESPRIYHQTLPNSGRLNGAVKKI
jgi:lipopolysaccharide/colanic/teichoic acid biosynthesis glycosyltransferase